MIQPGEVATASIEVEPTRSEKLRIRLRAVGSEEDPVKSNNKLRLSTKVAR